MVTFGACHSDKYRIGYQHRPFTVYLGLQALQVWEVFGYVQFSALHWLLTVLISSLESKVCFLLFCFVLHSENSNHSYNSKATHIFVSLPTFSFLTIKTKWIFCVKKKMAHFTDDRLHKSWRIFIRISAYLLYFLKNCLFWLCWVFICAQGFL